ncbi:MAG TPA: poly-gamma-glutamate hydrolase family protein [Acidimicrobiales bacterium]
MFAELLATDGVEEVLEQRGTFGFMAFHGGGLEHMTDVIARAAAERAGASYYGVHQPENLRWHIPSTEVDPAHSEKLTAFLQHVDIVITVHGFGRQGYWTSLLLGGQNRALAGHVARHLRRALPAYDIADDIGRIPTPLQGLHPRNPVNRPRQQGVQIELPPRVRGTSPMWWDWEPDTPVPHTLALIDGLAEAASAWPG